MYLATRGIPGGNVTSLQPAVAIGAFLVIGTVPAGRRWRLQSLQSDTTMTATVGNRILILQMNDPVGRIWSGTSSAVITAAQIGGYDVAFGSNNANPSTVIRRALVAAANTNVQVRDNCPIFDLGPGSNIVLADIAGIDVNDTVRASLVYTEYAN